MTRTKFFSAIFLITLFGSLISCMSTKFVMDPNLPAEPKRSLLTGLSISLDMSNDEESIITAASSLIGAVQLADFGWEAEQALTKYLGTKSFEVFLDASIAKKHDLLINVGDKATLMGAWVHPDTSAYQTVYFTGPTLGFNKKEYIAKVKGDTDIEYYVFADLKVSKGYTFMIFGGYPSVVFNAVIVNSLGEAVLEARAYGKGKSQFIGINMTDENLTIAFEQAIISLEELE